MSNAPNMSRSASEADVGIAAESTLDFDKLRPEIRRKLHQLCALDDYHAPLGIAFDFAVVLFSVWLCVAVSSWFYPVSLMLIGSTQRALVNILHEASHKVLTRSGWLNVLLGTVFSGYLVFHLYNPYRHSHIGFHHRFLGDPERDPDYSFHLECGLYDMDRSNASFFLRNVLLALIGWRTGQYVRYVVQDRLLFRSADSPVSMPISMRTERIVLATVWTAIVLAFALAGQLQLLLFFWLIPMFTSAVAIGWLSELAEHFPLPQSEGARILMTRNRHGWAIERFLLGRHNDNYHLVHHLNVGVPFWNMKKAHRVLLGDPAYARWDSLWAGILTRSPARKNQETLVSYAAKYRIWRQRGSEAVVPGATFAEAMMMSPRPRLHTGAAETVGRCSTV